MKYLSLFSLTFFVFLISNSAIGQGGWKKDTTSSAEPTSETFDVLTKNEYTPGVFLGLVGANPTVNNLTLNTVEKKMTLQGVLFSNGTNFTSAIKLEGEDENKTLNIFSGTRFSSKFTGNISATYLFRPWVKNYLFEKNRVFENLSGLTYNYLASEENFTKVRHRFDYITFGISGSGASYNLLDSTVNFNDMVSKEKFNGWQVYGQYNRINYNPRIERASVHTYSATYGEVNNIEDLAEYTFSNSYLISSSNSSRNVIKSTNGYFDDYIVQHQAVLSYEYNVFPMDTSHIRIGYILGLDFIYNERSPNFMRINGGFNFPVIYGKTDDGKNKHVYIAAIVSSRDPFNMMNDNEFKLTESFSFSLKLATSLNLNFKN